ncbi:MAG: sugar ABC transporter substrate-binding protein [Lachnospiraceae bacterium]|nr:sugar ABC transporter substrate-binding protein [Lachnospiraceae bacterium]
MKKLMSLLLTGVMLTTAISVPVLADETEAETEAAGDSIQADEDFYAAADLSVLEGKKIGITIQSLENAYWAGVMSALQNILDEYNVEYTLLSCDDNSATQISQIESFTTAGCDLIMVHPSDADAVEDVCAEARDAGIKVMCWDDPMENTDADWVLDNTVLGEAIGELAGEFINEYYSEDNPVQVALLGHPETKVLLERANGIKAGLENTAAGKYEIVAEQDGLEANDAQTSMETILAAYPDCKVVVGVGAGAMIGANEALMTYYNSEIPEDVGVFTTDVTLQQLNSILGDEATKGIIGFEGSDVETATACASMYALILSDSLDTQIVYRQIGQITEDNVEDILAEMM